MPSPSAAKSDEVAQIHQELLGYIAEIKEFYRLEPCEAMDRISSLSARVLELATQTLLANTRPMQILRLEWLERFKEELRFQFTIASRKLALQRIEWEQTK
jgi:hypothetical protein